MTEDLTDLPTADLILDLPDALGTSYSQLQTYRRCPQQWYYSYRLKLTKEERETQVLDFGSWWHMLRAAESIDKGVRIGSLRVLDKALKGPFTTSLDARAPDIVPRFWDLMQGWWGRLPGDERSGWLEIYDQDPVTRLRTINENWHEHWATALEEEEPLAVELWWTRTVQVTVDGKEIDLRLGGYIDEINWNVRRQVAVVKDHKSSGQLAAGTAANDMMESQLHLYGWGAYPIVQTWKLPGGRSVGAVSYDRVRTAKPKDPKINLDGTLSKSVKDYDLRTYLDWCRGGVPFEGRKKDGTGGGTYHADPEVVQMLGSDQERSKWFQRTLTPLNKNVIRAHLQSAVDTVRDQINVRARIDKTGEAPRNLGRNCNYCDFVQLCRAELLNGPMDDFPLEEYGLVKKTPR